METGGDSYYWGLWIGSACAVIALVVFLMLVRYYSLTRMRRGQAAIVGTSWMIRAGPAPALGDEIPAVAAPPYNPRMGDEDAGYYDTEGNFVSKFQLMEPERAHLSDRPSHMHLDIDEPAPPYALVHGYEQHTTAGASSR